MNFWIATTNLGKVKEFQALLPQIRFLSLKDLASYVPPEEIGKTFEDNARIKAKSFHAVKPNDWVIGEDSGLEVEGLNNMPGIHSARYAGEKARDIENISKVLKFLNLRSPLNRKAQFVCTMVVYDPNGKELVFKGILKGQISRDIKGSGGFGYDPIFIPEGYDKTLAELGEVEKNKISHRAKAIELFSQSINQTL